MKVVKVGSSYLKTFYSLPYKLSIRDYLSISHKMKEVKVGSSYLKTFYSLPYKLSIRDYLSISHKMKEVKVGSSYSKNVLQPSIQTPSVIPVNLPQDERSKGRLLLLKKCFTTFHTNSPSMTPVNLLQDESSKD